MGQIILDTVIHGYMVDTKRWDNIPIFHYSTFTSNEYHDLWIVAITTTKTYNAAMGSKN
jgi:hypothetical protein